MKKLGSKTMGNKKNHKKAGTIIIKPLNTKVLATKAVAAAVMTEEEIEEAELNEMDEDLDADVDEQGDAAQGEPGVTEMDDSSESEDLEVNTGE